MSRHVYPPELHWLHDTHNDREWMRHGLCRQHDPDMWFPPDRGGRPAHRRATEAQLICLGCPVQNACLHYALSTDTRFGIWGGATAQDRSRLTGRRFYG